MFGFGKKEMDMNAANEFWKWFVDNEQWIIANIKGNGMAVVMAIDEVITPVFPYFRKQIEFYLGFNDGVGEFFFNHLGNRNLIRDGKILASMMPSELADRWTFNLER